MPAHSRKYEFGMVLLLMLMWGVVGLNRIGIAYLFPILVPLFHLAYWQVGLLLSGTSVTWALSTWIGGHLSDRVGRKRVYLPALTFAVVVSSLMGAANSFLSLFIVRDLIGLGDGVGWSVGESTVADVSAPKRRAFNQGIYMGGYTIMGTGFGAIIITQLAKHVGWQYVYAIIAVFALVVLGILAKLMRNVRPQTKSVAPRGQWLDSFRLLADRQIVLLALLNILVLTWLQGFNGYAALFLTKNGHFPLTQVGFMLSIGGFVGFAGQILLPALSDRIGRKAVIIGSAVLASGALLLLSTGGAIGMGGIIAIIAVNGFFGWGLQPVAMATAVSESVTPERMGKAIGVTNFFGVVVGTMVMPLVLGGVAGKWGLPTAMLVVAIVEALVIPIGLALRETAPRRVGIRAGTPALEN